jgi:hypothetical protein
MPGTIPPAVTPVGGQACNTSGAVPVLAATGYSANADGAIQANGEGMAGVAVGRDAVERSIYILDALVRSLVERGLPLAMAGDGMRVERGKDSASIAMSERIRREKHVPTPEELAAEERRKKRLERHYATRRTWDSPAPSDLYAQACPAIDTIRTGDLVMQIQGWGDGVRRTWADGRTQRLDRMVEDVATGLEAILAARRLQRKEREERERRHQERARRHALATPPRRRQPPPIMSRLDCWPVPLPESAMRAGPRRGPDGMSRRFSGLARWAIRVPARRPCPTPAEH